MIECLCLTTGWKTLIVVIVSQGFHSSLSKKYHDISSWLFATFIDIIIQKEREKRWIEECHKLDVFSCCPHELHSPMCQYHYTTALTYFQL